MINWKKYQYKPFNLKPNKKLLPINVIGFTDVDEFNELYQYCLKYIKLEVPATLSQGIKKSSSLMRHERFTLIKGNQRFELIIIKFTGMYRFVLKNKKQNCNDETISGRKAATEVIKAIKEDSSLDINNYICDSEEGKRIKTEIVAPHIKVINRFALDKKIQMGNVHHIDLNSAYASKICEAYPELKPIYDKFYQQRHEKNDYFKHVLTNSIGCFQSEFCVNPDDLRTSKPYVLAKLAKIAVNGTYETIENMVTKLRKSGRSVLLTNTDGIWYMGNLYHDANEGTELGMWKHDHKNCDFIMHSNGAYQFIENNEVHTVVRGLTPYDNQHPDRSKWEFGIISTNELTTQIYVYRFYEGIGVKEEIYGKKN